jgi:uncharacterized membrane protein YccC
MPLEMSAFVMKEDAQSRFEVAWTRFVEINIGIVAAVLVGSFIWPNHARVRYFQALDKSGPGHLESRLTVIVAQKCDK